MEAFGGDSRRRTKLILAAAAAGAIAAGGLAYATRLAYRGFECVVERSIERTLARDKGWPQSQGRPQSTSLIQAQAAPLGPAVALPHVPRPQMPAAKTAMVSYAPPAQHREAVPSVANSQHSATPGNHSKILFHTGDWAWEGAPPEAYKPPADGSFKDVGRVELIGKRGESPLFHVRYFEIAPGGYTSLEKHVHEHVVIPIRGTGDCQISAAVYPVRFGDVAYICPSEPHQLRCPEGAPEPFGFLCIVNAERDRPVPVTQQEVLDALLRSSSTSSTRAPWGALGGLGGGGGASPGGGAAWRPPNGLTPPRSYLA